MAQKTLFGFLECVIVQKTTVKSKWKGLSVVEDNVSGPVDS